MGGPLCGLVDGVYPSKVEGKCVDCFAGIGAWSGGDVPANDTLSMDKTSLDVGCWPGSFDRGVCTAATIEYDHKGRL